MRSSLSKLIAAVPLFLASCWALAARLEEGASAPIAEGVPIVYVALFLLVFVGMIVGFFVYMWWLEKNKKVKAD